MHLCSGTSKGQGTFKNNMFAITRFRYIEVLFHIFYYPCGKNNVTCILDLPLLCFCCLLLLRQNTTLSLLWLLVINPILSFCSTQKSPISSQELSTPKETSEAVQVKQEPVPGAPVTPQEVEERKKVRCCKYRVWKWRYYSASRVVVKSRWTILHFPESCTVFRSNPRSREYPSRPCKLIESLWHVSSPQVGNRAEIVFLPTLNMFL